MARIYCFLSKMNASYSDWAPWFKTNMRFYLLGDEAHVDSVEEFVVGAGIFSGNITVSDELQYRQHPDRFEHLNVASPEVY